MGRAGKIGGTLFLSVFFLMGAGFFLAFGYFVLSDLLVYRWTATPAVIELSEIEEDRSEQDPYLYQVRYSYMVDGGTYTSEQFAREHGRTSSHAEVSQLVERYPAGGEVTCYVNPGDPTEAVLERPPLGERAIMALFLIIPVIFMLVGAGGIWAVWRKPGGEQEDAAVSIGAEHQGSTRGGRIFMAVFFTFFLVFGSIFPTMFFILPMYRAAQAEDWQPVEATVLSSSVRSHRGDDGTTYSVAIEFEYEWEGRTYRSDRYDFATGSSSGRASKQAVVDEHPPGSTTTAYVDPEEPHEAVISREFGGSMWIAAFTFIFPLVGLGGLIGVGISAMRGSSGGTAGAGAAPLADSSRRRRLTLPGANEPAHALDDGPVTLKSKESRWVAFIALLLFALVWNGFIFGLMVPDTGIDWFSGIFIAIGVAVFLAAIYQGLRLFNPTVVMQVHSGRIHLGDTMRLNWRLEGSAHRVKHLTVTLQGTEEATYRAGTRTQTDTHTFAEIPVGEFSSMAEIQRASAEAAAPERAMHTFKADNNRVLWAIHVHGDIRFWPDLDQSFEVHILPREPAHV